MQRHMDHLLDLLGRQRLNARWPGRILQQPVHFLCHDARASDGPSAGFCQQPLQSPPLSGHRSPATRSAPSKPPSAACFGLEPTAPAVRDRRADPNSLDFPHRRRLAGILCQQRNTRLNLRLRPIDGMRAPAAGMQQHTQLRDISAIGYSPMKGCSIMQQIRASLREPHIGAARASKASRDRPRAFNVKMADEPSMGVRLLPPFKIDVRPLWVDLVLFRIPLPGFLSLPMRRPVSLLARIVERRFARIFILWLGHSYRLSVREGLMARVAREAASRHADRSTKWPPQRSFWYVACEHRSQVGGDLTKAQVHR
jgi:hypothetical protein